MKLRISKIWLATALLVCFSLLVPTVSLAKKCRKKKKQLITQSVEGGKCGWLSGKQKWVAGSTKNNKFWPYKAQQSYYKCLGKSKKKKTAKRNRKAIQPLCNNLSAPQTLSLKDLPEVAKAFKSGSNSLAITTVSGTPPTIVDLADGTVSAKSAFWRSGVPDGIAGGSPTQQQCDEFWGSDTDGVSAGMAACYMVEGVGFALQQVLQGVVSTCYLQNAVSSTTIADGGVTLVSGSAPDNDLTKVFEPGSSQRTVKVTVSNVPGEEGSSETIFVIVDSTSQNQKKGNQYKATMWFCEGNTPTGKEVVTVDVNNNFTDSAQGSSQDSTTGESQDFTSTITAKITASNGGFDFDTNEDRSASVTFEAGSQTVKNEILVSGGTITQKTYDMTTVSNGPDASRLAYSAASFSSTSGLSTLRVLEGGYKDIQKEGSTETNSFNAGFEYRDTAYFSAPNATSVSLLNQVDIRTDSFYQNQPSVSADLSDVNCSITPDVVLKMDFSKSSMQNVFNACEIYMQQGFDICNSDSTISQAASNWSSVCGG